VNVIGALLVVLSCEFRAFIAALQPSGEVAGFDFQFVELDTDPEKLARTFRASGVRVVHGMERDFAGYIQEAIAHVSSGVVGRKRADGARV
jgi:hypothetical protein